ncbi:g12773 [Coccomyxa viridis]|uniref:G12773 protein n=1 Tax=Coccomyxa viridis TaxID=1274662 RepID=A0ABP1GGR0_9CHLO
MEASVDRKQEVNSAAYYCDCSRTGYKGATCSAPSLASGPSANLSASTSPCSPPCQHGGLCKQEVNSAAYYCDCSRTGFRGAFCAAQTNASSPGMAIQAVPSNASSCTPACQNGGACKQAVNSGAFYCDCSRTSYKGATCSALAAYSPAMSAASNVSACSPPCKNGAPCKQEVNSGAYYCKCQGTAFTGQDCSIAQGGAPALVGAGAGVQSTDAHGGGQGSSNSSIVWWGILIIALACVAGLVLIGFLGMLLVQQYRSSRTGSFARFREEGKFYNGSPEHNHGIEATRM